ncbi:MAG TPA: MlaD family protein [Longimicrobiales bacterium]|nr:MlaD family protein [Longimicrobiales bacterium]
MKRASEVQVGLVMIAGIVLIVVGTLWMQGWRVGEEEREVSAWFREVGQLQTGNPVKLRGVPIGRVEAVELDHGAEGVIVHMTIASEAVLPADPVVLLSPESLLGDWQGEILPRSRYPAYNYPTVPGGDLLPGYSLPDFSRLTAVADRIAENLAVITDRVDRAFTDETAVNVREAIDNIRAVTGQLTAMVEVQGQAVTDLAEGLEGTTRRLDEVVSSAQRTFAQVEAAIAQGELTNIVDNVERLSAQMDTVAMSLRATTDGLDGTVATADSAFTSLNQVIGGLERGQGTLGQLLQDTALYGELVITNNVIQDLLEDFQRNPRKYINLRVF